MNGLVQSNNVLFIIQNKNQTNNKERGKKRNSVKLIFRLILNNSMRAYNQDPTKVKRQYHPIYCQLFLICFVWRLAKIIIIKFENLL